MCSASSWWGLGRRRADEILGAADMYPAPGLAMTHLQPSVTACEDPHINPRADRTQHRGISAWVSSHVRAEEHHAAMASRAVQGSFAIAGYAQRLGYRVYRFGCACWRRQGLCHSDITRCASWAKLLCWSKILQEHPPAAEYQSEESTEL